MPMIRISTSQPYTQAEKQHISDIAQFCMEQYFATPKNDRFHFFESLAQGNIIVDTDYWVSRPRTEQFIQFYITAGKPRTVQQKSEFMQQLTQRISENFKTRHYDCGDL